MSEYAKHTWETGETITEEKLNNMETGIAEALKNAGKTATDIDFSDWENGSFTVTTEDGTAYTGSVTFDSEGNPSSMTLNGHTLTLTLPA